MGADMEYFRNKDLGEGHTLTAWPVQQKLTESALALLPFMLMMQKQMCSS